MSYPEQKAQELLGQLEINTLPIKPQEICVRLGVTYEEHPFDGFEGMLIVGDNSSVIGVNSKIETVGRKSYTAAHELGHLCMHAENGSKSFECSSDDIASISKNKLEIEANAFAAELIMPENLVMPIVRADSLTWDAVKSLAQQCEASLTAAAIRFISLCEFPCAFLLIQDGTIKFHRTSPEFNFQVDMDSRIIASDTQAYQAHRGTTPQSDFIPIHPGSWLRGKFTTDSEVLEWSLPKNRYGQVLTLLLDEGDICFAKDSRDPGHTIATDDDEDGLGVDRFMREVNPFVKSKRRR